MKLILSPTRHLKLSLNLRSAQTAGPARQTDQTVDPKPALEEQKNQPEDRNEFWTKCHDHLLNSC